MMANVASTPNLLKVWIPAAYHNSAFRTNFCNSRTASVIEVAK